MIESIQFNNGFKGFVEVSEDIVIFNDNLDILDGFSSQVVQFEFRD